MLGKIFDKILHEDEKAILKLEQKVEKEITEAAFSVKKTRLDLVIALLIFIVALGVRLYFLFYVTDPQNPGDGWAGDVFHHWQIAYLTREVGLKEAFLRLWDLKGMEYFWGPLHPLLMILMFKISGNVSIVNARVLSLIFGSLFVGTLYLLGKKYWNRSVGLAASLLAAVNPVAILDDTFGLLEPIGFFLIFAGLLILETAPFVAGIIWALASTVRAEAWIYGLILLFLSYRVLKKPGQLAKVFIGWFVPTIIYMKYLLDHTGNPVYPIWWNYLANARGVWATEIIYTPYQLYIKPYLIAWLIISLLLLIIIWWRDKSKGSIIILFCLANWIFIAGMMGLTHYLTGFQPWFWYIRFFEYPYIFAGLFVSIFFFYLIPKLIPIFRNYYVSWIFWIPIVVIAIVLQLIFWKPILEKYDSTRPAWEMTKNTAKAFGDEYKDGKVLIIEGDPNITYALVYYNHINGENIIGQMFDPFFYIDGDAFDNWGENREKVLGFIKDENIKLILLYDVSERYFKMFEREKEYFEFVKQIENTRLLIYKAFPERINLE